MEKEHWQFLRSAIPRDGRPVDAEDHLIVASLRRSLDNIQGLLAMADQRNVFCGMPIIRFQLDTGMRLFGRKLAADVNDYVEYIAKKGKLNKYRDRNGLHMTDRHLHTELTKKHPHVSDLYEESSGYVHFSYQHIHRVLDLERYKATKEAVFKDPEELTAGWNDQELRGALLLMMWATQAILAECKEWLASKRHK